VSYTVTGTSGTVGFSNMTLPKTAIPYGTTPLVYIDGTPAANQGNTKDATNYYVWYTTHFSTHLITIQFTTPTSTPTPTPPPSAFYVVRSLYLWLVAVIIVAAITILILIVTATKRSRRKKPDIVIKKPTR